MASIKLLGTYRNGPNKGRPRYRVVYRTPEGVGRTTFYPSKKAAQDFAADVESEKRRGAFVDPARSRMTLETFWTEWFAEAERVGKPRVSTLAKYAGIWRRHLKSALGDKQLAAITRPNIVTMLKAIDSPHEELEALKLTRRLLNAAVDGELLAINRAARLRTRAISRKRPRVLTPEELARLVEAIEERYRALVLLNAWGGFRWSEVVCLETSAVDFLRRQVRIERAVPEVAGRLIPQDAKTLKSRRTVPVPAFVIEALAEHVRKFPPKETEVGELLFTTETGKPIKRSHFRTRVWIPATERAKLPGFTVRHLRHTGASLVLEAGGNLKDVAERLGHTTTRMADELYVELYESRGRELVARMERLAEPQNAKQTQSITSQ